MKFGAKEKFAVGTIGTVAALEALKDLGINVAASAAVEIGKKVLGL